MLHKPDSKNLVQILSFSYYFRNSNVKNKFKLRFKSIYSLLLLLLLIQLYCIQFVAGQIGADCHFPRLTPRHGLKLSQLMGSWFLQEFASSDRNFDSIHPSFKCTRVQYIGDKISLSSGKFMAVESFKNSSNGELKGVNMPIRIPDNRNVVNSMWDVESLHGPTKMLILATDLQHSKWMLLYSCNTNGGRSPGRNYRWETIGIWSRSRQLDDVTRQILKSLLVGLGLPLVSHKGHNQVDC